MSLPIPNLDDRNFETLIDEARSLIPVYSREWTNHNYSDPGIMLLELFAWLTESTLYRLNQIPEATYRRYLKLLGTEQLFTWEALPGEDNGRLLEFLAKNYGLDWIKSAWIRRNGDGEIVVTDGTQTVSLKLDQANAQINLSIENGPRDELIVKRVQTQLFNWQRIPGVDTYRLYQFLQQFYAVDWTRSARLEKSSDRKSLWLSNESDTVRLQLDATGKQVDIVFNVGNTFSVPFQTESEEVFKWERIPGKDTPKLQQFLTQYYGIHWENGASLVKEADGETIIVQNGNDRFCLIRDEAESRIQIIFDNQGFQPVTVQFPDNHLLFCWTHVPGKAERRIIRFLRKYYGVPWVTNAAVIKSPDGHSVTITDQEHRINLIKNRSSGSNSLQLNAGTQYQFELKQEKNYLFNWDNIPGSDNRRLLEYLYKNYAAADWVRTASIERGDTDTIIISQDHHRLTIRRNSPDEIRLTFEPGIPYQFSIKRKLEGFFNWERFDIIDQTKVRQFLWQNYGLEWVKEAAFVKDTSRNLITLQAEAGKILLRPEDDGDLVVISFFAGNAFTFQLQAEPVMQRVYQSIEKDLLRGVQRLSRPYRAVTISDYEVLAKECLEWLKPGLAAASRVICIPNRDWEYGQSGIEKPGHLTVILIPGLDTPELEWEQVTGPDQGKFRELLWIIYRLEWIKTARIQKNSRGNLVMVFGEQTAQTIFGIMDVTGERVKMVLGLEPKVLRIVTDGEKRMAVDEDNNHSKPWFCWEDLPGTDNPQLIDYLRRSLGAAWAKLGKIRRLAPEWLSVSDESDTILLYLDNEAARIRIYRSKHPIQLDLRQKNDHSAIYGYSAGAGQPTALLKQAVLNYLNQRRLLTTRIHVVNPSYQQIKLEVSVVLRPNTHGNETLHQALQGIYRYFDPVRGGPEGTGWPLGRGLYRSEVCALVERIPGIDHISKIVMNDNEEAAMVKIAEHQLIQINPVVIEEKVYHE